MIPAREFVVNFAQPRFHREFGCESYQALLERQQESWQSFAALITRVSNAKRRPFIEREFRFIRKDLSRDRATRVVALLDHVLRKLFWIRIAFTRQQKGVVLQFCIHPVFGFVSCGNSSIV